MNLWTNVWVGGQGPDREPDPPEHRKKEKASRREKEAREKAAPASDADPRPGRAERDGCRRHAKHAARGSLEGDSGSWLMEQVHRGRPPVGSLEM